MSKTSLFFRFNVFALRVPEGGKKPQRFLLGFVTFFTHVDRFLDGTTFFFAMLE